MQRARDRLISAGYALGWAVVRRMPEGLARRLFMLVAEIAWRRQGKGVQQLEANLRRVVGQEASGKQLRELSRAAMRSYLRYWLEVFRLPVIGEERIVGHMRAIGEDTAFAYIAAGRGVVFALPHMGNWDHAGAWIIARGAGSFTTVMERLRPDSLYEMFVAFRESLGMEVLPLTGSGVNVFGVLAQRLRAGRMVCLPCDRDLTASGVEVTFFGERARMAAGPAALAVQTGAALLPVTLWYDGEYWAAHINDEIPAPAAGERKDRVAAMTQQIARVFEAGIREHPADWHMLQKVFVADLDPNRLAPAEGAAAEASAAEGGAPTDDASQESASP